MKSFIQTPDEMEDFVKYLEEDLDNIKRVKKRLNNSEIPFKFEIHPKAETVNESASYSPIKKQQIIKTLIFKAGEKFVGVLCPGNKRVDEEKMEKLTSSTIRMAKPAEVRSETGYIVGGVSPFDLDINLYIDSSLLEYEEVRPAAGSKLVGVCLNPQDLKELTNAKKADIAE